MKIIGLLLLSLLGIKGFVYHQQRLSDTCVTFTGHDKYNAQYDNLVKYLTIGDYKEQEPFFIFGTSNKLLPENFPVKNATLNIELRKGDSEYTTASAKLKSCQDDCIVSEDEKGNLKLNCK